MSFKTVKKKLEANKNYGYEFFYFHQISVICNFGLFLYIFIWFEFLTTWVLEFSWLCCDKKDDYYHQLVMGYFFRIVLVKSLCKSLWKNLAKYKKPVTYLPCILHSAPG